MRLVISASVILLALSTVLLAQMSPEEAQLRMEQRQAKEKEQAQQAAIAATQPSNLTNGEVAALRKTIARQQFQIAELNDQMQQLKGKLAMSQLNLHNAQAASDAQAKESPDAAANTPITQDINAAMAQHTLAVGMTLDQCNQSLGSPGRITGANSDGTFYEWGKLTSAYGKGPADGYIPFTGTIANGKLVSFEQSSFVLFSDGRR